MTPADLLKFRPPGIAYGASPAKVTDASHVYIQGYTSPEGPSPRWGVFLRSYGTELYSAASDAAAFDVATVFEAALAARASELRGAREGAK